MTGQVLCTLFDSNYLPQGLALLQSLERHAFGIRLWVLAMDEKCYQLLTRLNHSSLNVLSLEKSETDDLRKARMERSWAEYCWTWTPFLPSLVMDEEPEAEIVTYIDADCWLAGPIAPLLKRFEESGAHCMITPHAYSKQRDRTESAGTYCVQFMPFRRTDEAAVILNWWQQKCLEQCSKDLNSGSLGDQGYLEDWPSRFGKNIYVLDHPALTLAPWNIERLWKDALDQLCLYHFQGFRLFTFSSLLVIRVTAGVPIPKEAVRLLLDAYVGDILTMTQRLPRAALSPRSLPSPLQDLRGLLLLLPRFLFWHWIVWLKPLPPSMRKPKKSTSTRPGLDLAKHR